MSRDSVRGATPECRTDKPLRVVLKGAFDQTQGTVMGELDGLLRVKWDDGLRGIYWRLQLEICNGQR